MELTLGLASEVAREVLGPDVTVTGTERLKGSDRSLVARVSIDGRAPVIVKLHRPAEGRTALVREPAGLELVPLPRLIGVSTSPPGVVMEDLGTGENLADSLLGDDPAVARSRVLAWAESVARTQVDGEGFAEALERNARRLGTPTPLADGTPGLLDATAEALASQFREWGIEPSRQALDELRGLDGLLGGDVRRLSPTDTCPDNCLWVGDRFVLLDYESAQVRHVAWDAAYFQVPFPSCWCSWALPDDLAAAALARWKQTFDDRYVGSAAFEQDLRIAQLGWAFIAGWWFMERALAEDDVDVTRGEQPSARARLVHRFGNAPDLDAAPALSALAREVHHAAVARWGALPLPLAPAFRQRGGH